MADKLPVPIHPNDLKEHPDFKLLLDDLGENILANGTTRELHERMVQAQQTAESAKVKYTKLMLLYSELYNLVVLPSAQGDSRIRKALEEAELQLIAPMLGVDGASIREMHDRESGEHSKAGFETYRQLESALSKKCASLVEFYEPTQHAGGSMELQVAKGLQFAQVIATKISKLEAEDHHLILDSVNNTLGFWEYYSVLEKVLSVLSTLTTTQKEQTHSDNLIFSKWLQERLQTTQLKLQVLGYQFREATYTKATTTSLKVIGQHLDNAITQAKQQHEKTVAKQQQYEAIGLGFAEFAREYSALVKECQHKEWALRELQDLDNG